MATKKTDGTIRLQRIEDAELVVPVIGMTPVIPHRWSEKAKEMMATKQQSARGVRAKKEPKDPEKEAYDATYWMADGSTPGMPATAFKGATADGCRFFEGLTMTDARRMLYFQGEGIDQLVPIEGEMELWEAAARNQTGVADLRYRYRIFPWRAELHVRFPVSVISPASVLALIDAGGRNGVGDWRPSSPRSNTGTYGQYRVDDDALQGAQVGEG
jgi:hypothetical protein